MKFKKIYFAKEIIEPLYSTKLYNDKIKTKLIVKEIKQELLKYKSKANDTKAFGRHIKEKNAD